MEIVVHRDGWLERDGRRIRCALGKSGVSELKVEGDGKTPVGRFALRRVLYRGDRVERPITALPAARLQESDAWCDDPEDARYNTQVSRPYPGRTETLWRDDHLYDIVVVLGHNDNPVEPGRGSAIFLHVAGPGHAPTEGCVALAIDDLVSLLEAVSSDDELEIL